VPAGAAVAADLNLLARSQRAVGARHDQRGVAGDEVVIVPPSAVSVTIAVIASVSAGAPVSMVMAWLVVVPILPAVSTIRACR